MIPQSNWRRTHLHTAIALANEWLAGMPILSVGNTSLVSFYKYEDSTGKDETGNYPATHVGSFNTVAGFDGNAQQAVDTSDYISIANLGTWFAGRSEFSIVLYDVVPPAGAGSQFSFCVSNTTHVDPYYRVAITILSSGITLRVNGYTGAAILSYDWPSGAPSDRHCYIFRYKDNNAEIIYDGTVVANTSAFTYPIGSCNATAMRGRIPAVNSSSNAQAVNTDHMRIFGHWVTDEEVVALNGPEPTKTYDAEVMFDDPFAFYKLEEASGTTANDYSGNGRHGTYAGTVTKRQPFRAFGGGSAAPLFDPTSNDSQITLPFTDTFSATGLTLEILLEPDATQPQSFPHFISNIEYYASAHAKFPASLRYDTAAGEIQFRLDSGNDYSADLTLSHIIAIEDIEHAVSVYRPNGNCELWVNGTKEAEATFSGTIANSALPWLIGAAKEYSGGVGEVRYKGKIGRTLFYAKALAAERINARTAALTNALSHGTLPNNDAAAIFTDPTYWQWDATRGYYRSHNDWNDALSAMVIPNVVSLRRISATFTSYYNTPGTALGINHFLITLDDSTEIKLGTRDGHADSGSGQSLYKGDEPDELFVTRDAVDEVYQYNVPSNRHITKVEFVSSYYTGYPEAQRGFKDVKLGYF